MAEYQKSYGELNEEQRLAVDTIDGPLLVLAPPGTGKTQLLSVRAASILDKRKANPENILIVTYTNSAAKAMKERLAKVIGYAGYDIEVGTFHSFANSIIQESEEAVNYVGDKILMSDVERMRIMEYILDNTKGLDEIRPFRAPYTYVKELLKKIGDLKKDGISPRGVKDYIKNPGSNYGYLEEKYIKRLKALSVVYERYEELKEGKSDEVFDERGRYDFDDIILFATEALKKERPLREEYQRLYRYVMVDEYQDTNESQIELLFTLLDYKNPNLCCVGDDDQSIYRFQGASVGNFRLLKKRLPGLKVMSLKNNYRSSKELIDISNRIISLIPPEERMGEKPLESVRQWREKEIIFREFTTVQEELVYLVDKVRELKERIEKDKSLTKEERLHPYNNIAVLVRKRNDILKVVDAFLMAGIPYATDGKEDISGEKRVKQLLDVLELAGIRPEDYGSGDLSLYKVLSADYFRIPHADILNFIGSVNDKKKKSRDPVTFIGEFLKKSPFGTMDNAWRSIKNLLEDARAKTVHALLMEFIKEAGIFRYILKEYADNEILKIRELRALGSFVNMVKTSDLARPAIRIDDFMAEIKTLRDHDLSIQGNLVTLTQEGVRVYTAHGSKGLEFYSVIIPFCLQNKNWPARPIPEKIQLPADLFKTKQRAWAKEEMKQLALQDETRLFYVAATRAKSGLIFTASPTEDSVSSLYLKNLDINRDGPEYIKEEEVIEKSLDMTDLSDPFIGTEEVLKDLVENLSLNPTRLNTYITCPRRFLYNDVLKLPGPKKKSLIFGNCVHKALEETYRQYKEKKQFPAFRFFQDSFRRELRFQGVDELTSRECIDRMNDKVRGWFEAVSKNPVLPIGLEKKLLVTIGDNIIFTGKYDKVEWEDEKKGLVRIVDYKTGKPDEHLKKISSCSNLDSRDCDGYLRQLVGYKLLFEKDKKESVGRKVGCGVLVFIEPVNAEMRSHGYKKGEYVTRQVAITEEMVDEIVDLIKQVSRNIKQLKFDKLKKRDEKICGMCDFEDICWGR